MSANLRFSSNTVNGKNSLGGAVVTSANGIYSPNTTAANVVFDEVLKSENIAGTPDYRCLYLKNDFASQVVYAPKFEFKSATNTAKFQIAFLTDKNVVAQAITDENTAPTGLTFVDLPFDEPTALIKGANDLLLTGEYVGFWLKRIPTNLGSTGTVTGEVVFQIRYKN
jgi:hypothetical protein